jgi:hypothetical protein
MLDILRSSKETELTRFEMAGVDLLIESRLPQLKSHAGHPAKANRKLAWL